MAEVIASVEKNSLNGFLGARCSSVVRAFAHGVIGRQIDPSWWTRSEM